MRNLIETKKVENSYVVTLFDIQDVTIFFIDYEYNEMKNKEAYMKLLIMDSNELEISILNIMSEYIEDTNSKNMILSTGKMWDLDCMIINNGNIYAKINTRWDDLNVIIPILETEAQNRSLPIDIGRDIIYVSKKISLSEGSANVIFKDPKAIDDAYVVLTSMYFARLLRQPDVDVKVQLKRTYDLQPSYIKTAKLLQDKCRKFDKVFCKRLLYYAKERGHYSGDIENIKYTPQLYVLTEVTIDKDSNAWISVMSLWDEEVTVKICNKGKLLEYDDMEIIGSKTGYLI